MFTALFNPICTPCRYEVKLVPEASSAWELATPVEGQPGVTDVLNLVVLQCMAPIQGGGREKPKQLLLAYRYVSASTKMGACHALLCDCCSAVLSMAIWPLMSVNAALSP
jgi:hypothetical protein